MACQQRLWRVNPFFLLAVGQLVVLGPFRKDGVPHFVLGSRKNLRGWMLLLPPSSMCRVPKFSLPRTTVSLAPPLQLFSAKLEENNEKVVS